MRFLIFALLFALPAQADVRLTLFIDGYSDLFKKCEHTIRVDMEPDWVAVVFGYDLPIEGKGVQECTGDQPNGGQMGTSCHAPPDFSFTCEEFQGLVLKSITCYGADSQSTSCGSITLSGPGEGMFRFPDD